MNKHTIHQWAGLAFGTGLLLTLVATQSPSVFGAVDCDGKPYGYPGCPIIDSQNSNSSSPHCGDGVVQKSEGEECDLGYDNGNSQCSSQCKLYTCGDGVLTKSRGEECEPEVQEVYVQDPQTGRLGVQREFVTASCGMYCVPPIKDTHGKVIGGCTYKFLAACTSSSSASGQTITFQSTVASSSSVANIAAVQSSSSVSSVASIGSSAAVSSAPPSIVIINAAPAPSAASSKAAVQSASSTSETLNASQQSESPALVAPVEVHCGDGIVQGDEECDDGNTNNNDYCSNTCLLPRCGDGILQPGELCDAGEANKDGRSCRIDCTIPTCGDGALDPGEACDNGTANSDTVPGACRMNCTLPRCGDGLLDAGEVCDDGNQNDADGCTNHCLLPRCGDGIVQPGEACDNGTANSDTVPGACRMNCSTPRCGDKVVDAGEECDGSADCTDQCKHIVAGAGTASTLPNTPATPSRSSAIGQGIIGASIIVIAILGYLMRNEILVILGIRRPKRDLDDVPLDEIEMPWHKW